MLRLWPSYIFLMMGALAAGCMPQTSEDVWRPFSDDSPWNMPISEDAKFDENSKALIQDTGDAGRLYLNKEDWSIPAYFIDSNTTPKHHVVAIKQGIYGKGFGPDKFIPIPDNVVPSPPMGGDNHLAIIDKKKAWNGVCGGRDKQL